MQITITAAHLKYLAELVDQDTTGDKDDPLYQELIELWITLDDGDTVLLRKAGGQHSYQSVKADSSSRISGVNQFLNVPNVLSTRPKVSPTSPLPRLREDRE